MQWFEVIVMDREADFYELFDEQRRSRRVELLVRAKHDRAIGEELNLFDSVRHSAVQSQLQIPVPRQSSRAKKSKQKARVGHEQRTAHGARRVALAGSRVPACVQAPGQEGPHAARGARARAIAAGSMPSPLSGSC